jgi:hypothetical protein
MRQSARFGMRVVGVIAAGVVVGVLGWTEDRISLEPPVLTATPREYDYEYSTTVRIVNHSIREVRIVNVPSLCFIVGCVSVDAFPDVIPPLGSVEMPLKLWVLRKGGADHLTSDFAGELPIFTDSPGTPKLLLKFEIRVEPESTEDTVAGR